MTCIRLILSVAYLTLNSCYTRCYGLHTIRPQSTDKHNVNTTEGHVLGTSQEERETYSNESSEVNDSHGLRLGTLLQHSASFAEKVLLIKQRKEKIEPSYQWETLRSLLQSESTASSSSSETDEIIKIFVDGEKPEGPFEHIWRSSGLCPPDPHSDAHLFLLSQDELQNLALIGSLPNDGIAQVRIHWLLDLVNATVDDLGPKYNYTHLDSFMNRLRQFNLKPGFEIMGNPGDIFTDFENVTQVTWWRRLVAQTARRYVEKYGLEWVASWNWETWNEPDHHDFDSLNFTLQGFLNYYDACRMGLDDVSPEIVFGGPGGSCRDPNFSKICWALLHHCNNGSSIFTPGVPPGIDFISFHKKGQQDADTILEKELPTVAHIYDQYPALRQVPVMNEFQINNTTPHQVHFVKKPAYTIMALLSLLGDRMLSYTESFKDKRLSVLSTCRHCVVANSVDPVSARDALIERDATRAMEIDSQSPELVRRAGDVEEDPTLATGSRKSSGTGEELLKEHDHKRPGDLRENPVTTRIVASDNKRASVTSASSEGSRTRPDDGEYFSYSVTSGGGSRRGSALLSSELRKIKSNDQSVSGGPWEATLLLSLSNGTEKNEDEILKVKVSFALPEFLVGKNLSLATYRLTADVKGPYEAWLELGSPIEPNRTELAYIRSFEGAVRDGPQRLQAVPPSLDFKVNLTMPSVLFIHLCEESQELQPGQVTNVSTISITSADVLITWSDALISTRCVWYYEVQRSQTDKNGPYQTISNQDVTDNNYTYSLPEISGSAKVDGWYRVRVVTYWGSTGAFSEPFYHSV
ncbi:alpha-L-iduronidase-like isoform X2 [Macrobrachium nipponense]|uniref:alpha-L-iduronidase-like isoform X2 n=1 Tax=Macrobrachium nipponense TaxID=159736 RepID=UPI0030C7E740